MVDKKDDCHDHPCCFGGKDIVVPLPQSRMCVRHTADHRMQVGALFPIAEGTNVSDNTHIVEEDADGDLRVGPTVGELKASGGPDQVATPRYRTNWERTFGKQTVGIA